MPNKIHAKQELYYKILQSNGSPHLVKVTKNFFVAGLCILSPFLILQAYNKMSFLFFTLSENLKLCPKNQFSKNYKKIANLNFHAKNE